MAIVLGIETATQSCSVSLGDSSGIIARKSSIEKNAHAKNVSVFIDQIFKEKGMSFSQLDAIAVSKGPGSYTGLRIGVSTAKGLCYALNKPLIAVNTLRSMAYEMAKKYKGQTSCLLCPMIDARRMEVYSAIFDIDNQIIRETHAEVIHSGSFSDMLKDHNLIFFGDGAAKCEAVLGQHPHSQFIPDIHPSANPLVELAQDRYNNNEFEDVAYFEPYYLKDFIAGKPRVKGLYDDK